MNEIPALGRITATMLSYSVTSLSCLLWLENGIVRLSHKESRVSPIDRVYSPLLKSYYPLSTPPDFGVACGLYIIGKWVAWHYGLKTRPTDRGNDEGDVDLGTNS